MALEYDGALIAGKAYVMVGAPGTPCPDLETINPHTTDAGFESIGEISAENIFNLEMEGGESVNRATHANPTFRTTKTPATYKLNVNALTVSASNLNLVFNGVHDPSKMKFTVRNGSSNARKAVFVLIVDGESRAGLYFSTVSVNLGSVPTFSIDGFTEIPMSCSVVEDPITGDIFDFLHPALGEAASGSDAELLTTINGLGEVESVTIANGGTGYLTAPTLSFVGGGATVPATATATVLNGRINSVTVTDGGEGYTSDPEVVATR